MRTNRAPSGEYTVVTMLAAEQSTSVLALSLVELDLLKLHAPVAETIPEFGVLGKEKDNLFHLLTHTNGVMPAIPPVASDGLMDIEKLLEFACTRPLESQPGERANYSILVGRAIIASMCLSVDGRGQCYAQMLAEDVFAPL